MSSNKKLWLGAALCALLGWAGKARAAAATNPAFLNIDVTFSNAMSVVVDGTASSTYTVNWTSPNQQLLSPSSATVSNNSIVTERWKLYTNDTSLPEIAGASWTLVNSTTSVGVDQFALQAVFGSSNTADCSALTANGTWNLTTRAPLIPAGFGSAVQYTTAGSLASPELISNGQSTPDASLNGGSMYGAGKRALCWRVIAPQSTSATQTQNIQVIIAAY
jgi:hypothetical protein